MKKYLLYSFPFCCCFLLLQSCHTASPEKYFDVAVLNSNMLRGFADKGLLRELESPSVKMNEAGQAVPMKRSEVISSKIAFVETNLGKLNGLMETADTKDILQTSLVLYEYVLPVYKTEYMRLADLYDKLSTKELIQSQAQAIHDKYYSRYEELYNKLIVYGKLYAEKHAIKVNWGM